MNETINRQDIVTPPDTSAEELRRILAAQDVETQWWKNAPKMESQENIQLALKEGWAVVVPVEGKGYKISPGVREEFKVLEKNTFTILQEIGQKWIKLLEQKNKNTDNAYLRITSLARTTAFQQELIKQGYPAAPDSTHTKLGAFDILISWFESNRPDLLDALTQVLEELSKNNTINFIEEPEIGVYHVAFNRTTVQ